MQHSLRSRTKIASENETNKAESKVTDSEKVNKQSHDAKNLSTENSTKVENIVSVRRSSRIKEKKDGNVNKESIQSPQKVRSLKQNHDTKSSKKAQTTETRQIRSTRKVLGLKEEESNAKNNIIEEDKQSQRNRRNKKLEQNEKDEKSKQNEKSKNSRQDEKGKESELKEKDIFSFDEFSQETLNSSDAPDSKKKTTKKKKRKPKTIKISVPKKRDIDVKHRLVLKIEDVLHTMKHDENRKSVEPSPLNENQENEKPANSRPGERKFFKTQNYKEVAVVDMGDVIGKKSHLKPKKKKLLGIPKWYMSKRVGGKNEKQSLQIVSDKPVPTLAPQPSLPVQNLATISLSADVNSPVPTGISPPTCTVIPPVATSTTAPVPVITNNLATTSTPIVTSTLTTINIPLSPVAELSAIAKDENKNTIAKPKIIQEKKLASNEKINVNVSPKTIMTDVRPFRLTNIFPTRHTLQRKTMLDHSLLRKLSPIPKDFKFHDENSPANGATEGTFSRVQGIIQSTPRNEKAMSLSKKVLGENTSFNRADVALQKNVIAKENILKSIQENSAETTISQKENVVPTTQNTPIVQATSVIEPKILKQTNLNRFFNIPDTPVSTTINTSHVLYSDIQETPHQLKVAKKQPKHFDIDNAFGFDDSQNSYELSNDAKPRMPNTKVHASKGLKGLNALEENSESKPARVSEKAIKNMLQPATLVAPTKKEKRRRRRNSTKSDVSLSDTFDIRSECEDEYRNEEVESAASEELFADLEPPTHFHEPPRYSYKRKRHVKYETTDDESECSHHETDHEQPEHHMKKKRKSKKEKEVEERVQQWVENTNKTFEEIEKYDLVVE